MADAVDGILQSVFAAAGISVPLVQFGDAAGRAAVLFCGIVPSDQIVCMVFCSGSWDFNIFITINLLAYFLRFSSI